jgi:hypothetical protein
VLSVSAMSPGSTPMYAAADFKVGVGSMCSSM